MKTMLNYLDLVAEEKTKKNAQVIERYNALSCCDTKHLMTIFCGHMATPEEVQAIVCRVLLDKFDIEIREFLVDLIMKKDIETNFKDN
jgi:hypothetical protein